MNYRFIPGDGPDFRVSPHPKSDHGAFASETFFPYANKL
jgi:hypothetical protein